MAWPAGENDAVRGERFDDQALVVIGARNLGDAHVDSFGENVMHNFCRIGGSAPDFQAGMRLQDTGDGGGDRISLA